MHDEEDDEDGTVKLPMELPAAELRLQTIFGLDTTIRGNCHYINDSEVLYPIGNCLAVHNFNQRTQKFIKISDQTRTITNIIFSPAKKMAAVSEVGPIVCFYDLVTYKKRKQIGVPFDSTCREFVCMDFSFDGKYLLAVLGDPDWILLFYNWRHGKLESQTKATLTNTNIVTQLSASPFDNTVCCMTGPGFFRTMSVQESNWRQFGFQKADMYDITSHCWLNFDRVAFGTSDGRIAIVESGDIKVILYATEITILNTKLDEEGEEPEQEEELMDEEIPSVERMKPEEDVEEDEEGIGQEMEEVKKKEEDVGKEKKEEPIDDVGDLVFSDTVSESGEQRSRESKVRSSSSEQQAKAVDEESDNRIRFLTYCTKGFFFNCGVGIIYVFEKDSPNRYIKKAILKVVNKLEELTIPRINEINFISINPAMDRIVCTTKRQQIFIGKVYGAEKEKEIGILSELGMPLHHGPICKIAVCMWKPLLITGGEMDRTIRIWNYELRCLQFIKQFMDDICSVGLHPSGLYCAVGFHDKLRYFVILIDSLKLIREFPIRGSKLIAFSHGGHLLAAVNGKDIQIYSTVTFMQTHVLRGHTGTVSGFTFTENDFQMMSCGTEGTYYEWNLPENARAADLIVKEVKFMDLAVFSTGTTSYIIGNDGQIRQVANAAVEREIASCADCGDKTKEKPAYLIVMSKTDNFMIVAGADGYIASLQSPWHDNCDRIEYRIHRTRITSMTLTFDDRYLITATEDGNIGLYKIVFPGEKMFKTDKDFKFSNEILIGFDELDEKLQTIEELKQRIRELMAEHEYMLAETIQKYEENKRRMIEDYTHEITQLREIQKHEELEHHEQVSNIYQDIQKMKQEHSNAMQTMENNYNKKLIVEYDKYQAMEHKCFLMREDYDRKLEDLLESKLSALRNLEQEYLEKLREKNDNINDMLAEKERMTIEHETIKADIEDDVDREIIELKTYFKKELKEQTQMNIKLRGEVGFLKKRLNTAMKDVDELTHKISEMHTEHERFQNAITKMERNIIELKRELVERDNTIQDKEKRIYELKLRCQELDKYKFVLNYKIKELKDMMEPKDREIREKKEQIFEMETELENLQFQTTKQDVRIADLKEKLNSTNIVLNRANLRHHDMMNKMRLIRIDLHNASGLIQDPGKLKARVRYLYHKYSQDPDLVTAMEENKCAQDEFLKQRLHLERTISSLKWQSETTDKGSYDIYRIMDENVSLIAEINTLRENLRITESRVRDLESLLGDTTRITASEAKSKLDKALTKHYEIENEYIHKIKENEKIIIVLKDEVNRLMAKLSPEEQIYFSKEKRKIKETVLESTSSSTTTTTPDVTLEDVERELKKK